MRNKQIFIISAAVLLVSAWLWHSLAFADTLSARAVVSDSNVFVGEPFTLQIRVSGSQSPDLPDLSHLKGFSVTFQGGSENSIRSITIVNGHMTKNIQQGYIFSYQLIPLHAGSLIIGPIAVYSGRQRAVTQPVMITAGTAAPGNSDFKLRIVLSKTRCYVGEPVTLTVTWYLGKNVKNADFTLPLLGRTRRFFVAAPRVNTTNSMQYYRVALGSGQVIAKKGEEELNGRTYTTLTFRRILIAKNPGSFRIDSATVSFSALVGYRHQNPFGNNFFSNFFQNFNGNMGFGQQGVYRKMIVASNPLTLDVLKLPNTGQPSDFSGLVGEYHIEDSALPTHVSMGDPITLTVTLSSPDYLKPVELPPLKEQPALSRDFKIPDERAVGEISGNKKIFTQTIRPLRAGIRRIPPIVLSYFDTRTGTYKTAKTAPISISVKATRIVTAQNAVGPANPIPSGNAVKTRSAGIARNYDNDGVLTRQVLDPVAWLRSPRGIGTLVLPPVLYVLLFVSTWLFRRQMADPMGRQAKKAGAGLTKAITEARHAGAQQARIMILEGFKTYLGNKLRMPAGALTFHDIRTPLEQKGVDVETLSGLKRLFSDCEAACYASVASVGDAAETIELAVMLLKKLEKIL